MDARLQVDCRVASADVFPRSRVGLLFNMTTSLTEGRMSFAHSCSELCTPPDAQVEDVWYDGFALANRYCRSFQ
jgi:hypothetical protein